MYRIEIAYNRETSDYACYLNGKLVGFARTYHEAEATLDQLVLELMGTKTPAAEAGAGARDESKV